MPGTAAEFVGLITGFAAEQAGQFAVPPLDQVHGKMAGALRYPVSVVAFR
jgi:hypothetical protein